MEEKRETFTYTYSAKEQEEVKRIRGKYTPKEADKLEQLRKLDQSATHKGTFAAIVTGVIGALTMGLGMCCTMVWPDTWFVPGIVIGLIGMAIAAMSYPLYQQITKRERKKIAPEIIRLTDELMK